MVPPINVPDASPGRIVSSPDAVSSPIGSRRMSAFTKVVSS